MQFSRDDAQVISGCCDGTVRWALVRESDLCCQPTGPRPLDHRNDCSRTALCHGSLNSRFPGSLGVRHCHGCWHVWAVIIYLKCFISAGRCPLMRVISGCCDGTVCASCAGWAVRERNRERNLESQRERERDRDLESQGEREREREREREKTTAVSRSF